MAAVATPGEGFQNLLLDCIFLKLWQNVRNIKSTTLTILNSTVWWR